MFQSCQGNEQMKCRPAILYFIDSSVHHRGIITRILRHKATEDVNDAPKTSWARARDGLNPQLCALETKTKSQCHGELLPRRRWCQQQQAKMLQGNITQKGRMAAA